MSKKKDDTQREVIAPVGTHIAVARVAFLLDKAPRFVREEIERGNLKGFKVGHDIVVEEVSLANYLKLREIKPATQGALQAA